jgi:TatD DNase family protein
MLYNPVLRVTSVMPLLVDSHCHINFEPLGAQLEALFDRARLNGVGHMLCVAVNLEDYPQVRALAHDYPQVFASVGVHPNERDGRDPDAAELSVLAQDGRVVAIGETGLDYFRSSGDMDWQQRRFREHIRAARAVRKPLIIHTRDAARDTLEILKDEAAREVGGVMHCFTEDWDTARQALDMNFYVSFSGIVTFRNAVALRAVAAQVPADRLLIETDAPYLAPMPYRGKTNEPAYVRHVAECLAELRGVSFETIAEQTTRNFFTLFSYAQPTQ